MNFLRKKVSFTAIVCFFIATFLFTSNDIPDPDMWFHLKAGEIIANNGLITKDFLSQRGAERVWYPYEWSFQLGLHALSSVFGVNAIRFFVGFFATMQAGILFLFVRKVLKLTWYWALGICLSYILLLYSSFTPRPQIISNALFLANLLIVLTYQYTGKNLLVLTIPFTYIWTTLHASVILAPITFILFTGSGMVLHIFSRRADWFRKIRIISLFAVIVTIISFLPPTGLLQYRYIVLFLENNSLFRQLHEWQPLHTFPVDFFVYTVTGIFVGIGFFVVMRKRNLTTISSILIPVSIFFIYGFTALRNTDYGYIVLLILLAFTISVFHPLASRKEKLFITLLLVFFVTIHGGTLYFRLKNAPKHIPQQAVMFLKKTQLKGIMFNEYATGGFLAYHLYPQYKVFIDGRTDVYLCCELPDYLDLVNSTAEPDPAFAKRLFNLFEKYSISFSIITYRDNPFGNKILTILKNNPNWALVFWDDYEAIYIKENGGNEEILTSLRTTSATPFGNIPYKKGQETKALVEYKTMDDRFPSAISKNNIGTMLLSVGNTQNAQTFFEDAIRIDQQHYFAYLNLANIFISEGKSEDAIRILEQGLRSANHPGTLTLYKALGNVHNAKGNIQEARKTFQKGLSTAETDEERAEFLRLLSVP